MLIYPLSSRIIRKVTCRGIWRRWNHIGGYWNRAVNHLISCNVKIQKILQDFGL